MDLTIAELSRATGKSGNYLRQHIHRKHLKAYRKGRRVYVSVDEAVRWARERGLPLDLPANVAITSQPKQDRTARMTVLTMLESAAVARNLFTLLRHRRSDALGPWAGEPDGTWHSSDLGQELRLFTFDAPLARCQELVDEILESGTLQIEDTAIHFDLEPHPRCHWAYRDDRPLNDASVRSPFSRHSAEVIEYWSFVPDVRARWLEMLKTQRGKLESRLKSIPFPLVRGPDRIGNLMIAGALDEITCDLSANRDGSLRFHFDAVNRHEKYRAEIWASHSGDDVLRKETPITPGQTTIEVTSDVDEIGFAVYRSTDGQCVDLMHVRIVLEVRIQMSVESGRTLRHQIKQGPVFCVTLPGDHSATTVESDHERSGLDKRIRRQWLEQRVYEQDTIARRDRNFARFGPDEFDEAVSHFIGLLRQDHDNTYPVYLADPYFMTPAPKSRCTQLYLEMFAATKDRELRILCTADECLIASPWWSNFPDEITLHIRVRSFRKFNDKKGAFHDRFLITPTHETLITHSLNGWATDGVTFAGLPYEIYRNEALHFWSMEIESTNTGLFVREVC